MLTRIITAVVALAVLVGVLMAPPIVFSVALAAVIIIMLHECYGAVNAKNSTRFIGFVSALAFMAAAYLSSVFGLFIAMTVLIVLHMVMIIIKHGKESFKDILASGFITLYVVFSMGCLWLTKEWYGTANMILVFVCAWSTDTFAYFTGFFLGKHKLIPHVSPKKTVEGAIGGVVGAIAISIAYLAITSNAMNINTVWTNIYIQGVIIGLVGGICSQLGDLTASAIKRDTGIKDFGKIFPGHGGFMDRFDSVMFIAPLIFAVMCAIQMF